MKSSRLYDSPVYILEVLSEQSFPFDGERDAQKTVLISVGQIALLLETSCSTTQ